MSAGSRLFTWIQGADFYRDLHRRAVELLPPGDGAGWLDVGCGPGLVARLAAARGYRALGVDSDGLMVRAARRLERQARSGAVFELRGVFELAPEASEVVSACSLLAVLGEKERALQALWSSVRPGGALLVVEPSERMTRANAEAVLARGLPPKRAGGLLKWAAAREGRAVSPRLYESVARRSLARTPLLEGLVDAWVLSK